MKTLVAACVFCILSPRDCLAQLPVGTIAGVVHDFTGGVIRGAQVQAIELATHQLRATTTGEQGDTDEGEYTSPVLYDRLSPTESFGFTGSAEGTITGQEIRLALNGSLTYWDESRRGSFWYCRTTDHTVTLRR